LQIKAKAEKLGVHINWMGRRDHLDPALQDYQVQHTLPEKGTCLQNSPIPCLAASFRRQE
jgi:hypothetical protein